MTAPGTCYADRAREWSEAVARLEARSARLSWFRLGTFGLLALGLVAGLWELHKPSPPWLTLACAAGLAFAAAVVLHARLHTRLEEARLRLMLNREGLARLARDWADLPSAPTAEQAISEPLAQDLDIFGRASLWKLLLGRASPGGARTLADWLLRPAEPDEIRQRQQAVQELSSSPLQREDLGVAWCRLKIDEAGCRRFLEWCEAPNRFLDSPALLWTARLMPVVTIALLVLAGLGFPAGTFWPLAILANLLFSVTLARRIGGVFEGVTRHEGAFRAYADLLRAATGLPSDGDRLRELRARLAPGDTPAHVHMRSLDNRVSLAELRRSMLYLPLQLLLLIDLHTAWLLERWRERAGRHARGWLEALGELEALTGLATLAHDNPQTSFPVVTPAGPKALIEAKGLAHPLLPRPQAVANDLRLGPPGRFLLVTGSNMSGKSTLLRTLGINLVLAQAGGPVFADSMSLPPVLPGTSIHVRDSLESGTSYFLAELKRLKAVVDLVEGAGERVPLFLLDEVLRGTNAAERAVAVREVLLRLLDRGAFGAVTTHDLALAEVPALRARCEPVHFTESFEPGPEGPIMRFDYLLRPGVATTRNALKLAALIGIPVDGDGDDP